MESPPAPARRRPDAARHFITSSNTKGQSMASLSDLYVIAAPLDHPEGIATGPDGELYAGGEAGQVYRLDQAAAAPVEIANTGGFVLGPCHDAAGMIYLGNPATTPAILRVGPATVAHETWCA